MPGDEPVPNLRAPARSVTLAQMEQIMLSDINELHARMRPEDLNLRARMDTFQVARGMMQEAPQVFDLSRESEATVKLYGAGRGDNQSFAAQCLTARRLLEAGVRVVELIDTGSSDNWDAHVDIAQHRAKAQRVDQPIAGLIQDLKQRGLFDQTLIAIATEFGRTPWTDKPENKGRNHWAKAFTCLLAGGGIKGGTAYGVTDDYGASIVSGPVHVHDYHATILNMMGLDHTRVTYRYAGRDFRLTDVSGRVVTEVIA